MLKKVKVKKTVKLKQGIERRGTEEVIKESESEER